MTRLFFKDAFVWGFVLWLVGYILGMVLFPIVPKPMLGWVIMPMGIIISLVILLKKVKSKTLGQYMLLGIVWTLIAIVCDYLFLVLIFKPGDGYYKLDVYVYYLLTFTLPILAYVIKRKPYSSH